MTLAGQLALWADTLRDVAAMGLRFTHDPYDVEHYRTIQQMAIEMMAVATGQTTEALEPLRDTLFRRPTPVVGTDAAIIDGEGRLLLIRRADDDLWAVPGGALAVGETPAQGAEREALEETGVHCRAVRLAGVFDSRLCGTRSAHHLYHLVFVCAPLDVPRQAPSHPQEVHDVRWFARHEIPADLSPGHAARMPYIWAAWRGGEAYFDR
jgi:ADP-ribose pyrophosphatase YjhB (NUDIX family)